MELHCLSFHPSCIPRYSSKKTDNSWPYEIFIAFPPSPPGFALHFVIFEPDASIALVFALSAVLALGAMQLCVWNYFNCTSTTPMADIRVTSVIETYQRRLNSKPYVPSTTFGRATLGTNGVANKLFLAFLFSDPDVGVQFLKDAGLMISSIMCCKFW